MKTLFLGVDPGASGGVAWIDNSGAVVAEKFGETERDIAGQFYDAIQCVNQHSDMIAMIEAVHSMPKQGVASSFTFGKSYGLLRGLLIGLGIPFEEVSPQKWQKAMGCLSKGDKAITKAKAQQLFPGSRVTHAVADAMLIAEHCRRTHGKEA